MLFRSAELIPGFDFAPIVGVLASTGTPQSAIDRISAEMAQAWADEAQARPVPERRIAGAVYISCAGRGGPHFGAPSAELQLVRKALGDVPLTGFFAGGEIAHQNLYGYTGVLTVFTQGKT